MSRCESCCSISIPKKYLLSIPSYFFYSQLFLRFCLISKLKKCVIDIYRIIRNSFYLIVFFVLPKWVRTKLRYNILSLVFVQLILVHLRGQFLTRPFILFTLMIFYRRSLILSTATSLSVPTYSSIYHIQDVILICHY